MDKRLESCGSGSYGKQSVVEIGGKLGLGLGDHRERESLVGASYVGGRKHNKSILSSTILKGTPAFSFLLSGKFCK